MLNERLNKFSDDFVLYQTRTKRVSEKGYSTIDNSFIVHSIFEILKKKKSKMYCCLIDFEKAFDKVWRDGLWYKLLLNNMNGNMHNVILTCIKILSLVLYIIM